MGKKGGKYKKKENDNIVKTKSVQLDYDDEDMMNDEIDAFHNNRDVVPLNINDDMEESDEDKEQPVFDFEDEDDEGVDNNDEDKPPKGRTAQIVRTQKYLRAKFGGPEDEVLDDADEQDEERLVWGSKRDLYGADSSDDEDAVDEEAEVWKLQREKAKALSMEDFGLESASQDEIDRDPSREPTFEEMLDLGKPKEVVSVNKGMKDEDGLAYEIVRKDLNALTKEEQMDIVHSAAPELIGLLSELNDAVEQLENKVTPLVNKIQGWQSAKKGEMHYLEVKQLLLQSFCQAIAFYLLLKTEGQPVRDHPVISRLVEIKSLLDKVKEMDEKLTFDVESIMNNDVDNPCMKSVEENDVQGNDSSEKEALVDPVKSIDLNISKALKNTEAQNKDRHIKVGSQSVEMLKIRASLEEKLKQKGLFTSTLPKNGGNLKHVQPVNRQLETLDDFVDDAMQIDGNPGKLTAHTNKRKVICGDDDIPKRDDIGERRRKHELRVLSRAGIGPADDENTNNIFSDESAGGSEESDADSDLEYYKQMERAHAAKLVAKSDKYSRTKTEVPSLQDTVDGKRNITHQMEKNRGLTRSRKKLTKNPRKKYKLKHKKAEVRRKGQVPDMRKPTGPYGGEASGINVNVSRSRRLNC